MDKVIIDLDVTKTIVYKKQIDKTDKSVYYNKCFYKIDGKKYFEIRNTLTIDDNDELVLKPLEYSFTFNHIGIFDSNGILLGNTISIESRIIALIKFIKETILRSSNFEVTFQLSIELCEILNTKMYANYYNRDNEIMFREIISSFNDKFNTNIIFRGSVIKGNSKQGLASHLTTYNNKNVIVFNDYTLCYLGKNNPNAKMDYYRVFYQWNNMYSVDKKVYVFNVGNVPSNPLKIKYHHLKISKLVEYKLDFDKENNPNIKIFLLFNNNKALLKQDIFFLDEAGYAVLYFFDKVTEKIVDAIYVEIVNEKGVLEESNDNFINLKPGEKYNLDLDKDKTVIRQVNCDIIPGGLSCFNCEITALKAGLYPVVLKETFYSYAGLLEDTNLLQELEYLRVGMDQDRYYNLMHYIFFDMVEKNESNLEFNFQNEQINIDCTNIIDKKTEFSKEMLDKLADNFKELNFNGTNTYIIVAIENKTTEEIVKTFLTNLGFKISANKGYEEYNTLLLMFSDLVIDCNGFNAGLNKTKFDETIHNMLKYNEKLQTENDALYYHFLYDDVRYYSIDLLYPSSDANFYFKDLDKTFKKVKKIRK